MQWHDVEQQEDEWWDMRAGKLTGSNMGKIMANYGKAFGEPAKKLAVSIAREQVTGKRSLTSSFSNEHTERGHIQEPIARRLYEDQTFNTVSNGGFFDCDQLGCSPDGLVFDEGVIEIKSVLDNVHFANIKRGGVDPAYKWQVFFELMTANMVHPTRVWVDFISYCADFPQETQLYIHRINIDECAEPFEMMRTRTAEFFKLVDESKPIIRGN